jgi:hypothetical protein
LFGGPALAYTDGLVEAHEPKGEMFGFPRLRALIAEQGEEGSLGDFCLEALYSFVGEGGSRKMTSLSLRWSAPRHEAESLRLSSLELLGIYHLLDFDQLYTERSHRARLRDMVEHSITEFLVTVLLPEHKHRRAQVSCDTHGRRYLARRLGASLEESDPSVFFYLF